MKKAVKSLAFLFVVTLLAGFSFTSCEDEEDEKNNGVLTNTSWSYNGDVSTIDVGDAAYNEQIAEYLAEYYDDGPDADEIITFTSNSLVATELSSPNYEYSVSTYVEGNKLTAYGKEDGVSFSSTATFVISGDILSITEVMNQEEVDYILYDELDLPSSIKAKSAYTVSLYQRVTP